MWGIRTEVEPDSKRIFSATPFYLVKVNLRVWNEGVKRKSNQMKDRIGHMISNSINFIFTFLAEMRNLITFSNFS